MNQSLYKKSVYTIRHSNELTTVYREGGTGSFVERKNWATAVTLLEEAVKTDQELPLLLAHSESVDGVRYWACIQSLSIDDNGHTTVEYSDLTPISLGVPLSQLILVNSNRPLRDDFFRPYAICYTPDFLVSEKKSEYAPDLEVDDIVSRGEGRLVARLHFIRERDRSLIITKKRQALTAGARLVCEVCNFDFEDFYGSIGADFCEVHHLKPLHSLKGETVTTLDDLAIVCSNCHRMIHRETPFLTPGDLQKRIKKSSLARKK